MSIQPRTDVPPGTQADRAADGDTNRIAKNHRASAKGLPARATRRTGPYALLTPGEVAALFGVDTQTVTRWEKAGKLTCLRTLGGHRRFLRAEVERLRSNDGSSAAAG